MAKTTPTKRKQTVASAKKAPAKKTATKRPVSTKKKINGFKKHRLLITAVLVALLGTAVWFWYINRSSNTNYEVVTDGSMVMQHVLGDSTAGVYRVYMSPTGSDKNSGATADKPVRTINQVQRILHANKPKTNVEVRIKQGVYRNQSVEWNFFVPGRTISFMPSNYNYGDNLKDIKSRPRFVGNKNERMFLRVNQRTAINTNMNFYYLQIEKYWAAGIVFNGGEKDVQTPNGLLRRPATSGVNGNRFYGLYIKDIGNKPTGLRNGEWGYAGIQLENSSNNTIQNNVFENLVNAPGPSHIHGLYIDHGSSNNVISRNMFRKISGSPIKFRNSSNNNLVDRNTFKRTGIEAAVYDSHQEGSERSRDKGTGKLRGDECSSINNIVRNNKIGRNYTGKKNLPVVSFRKGGNKYAGKNDSCPSLKGKVRASLSNNVRIKD